MAQYRSADEFPQFLGTFNYAELPPANQHVTGTEVLIIAGDPSGATTRVRRYSDGTAWQLYGGLGYADQAALVAAVTAIVNANVMTLVQSANGVLITSTGPQELTLSTPQGIRTTDDPTFRDLTVRKLQGSGLPTLSAWGTGAGSNSTPTAGSISGTDLLIKVTVTPSATPAANSTIASIAWSGGNGEFAQAPDCIVLPLNHAAQGVLGSAVAGPIATGGVNGVVLTSGATTALTAGTSYVFGILVLGK